MHLIGERSGDCVALRFVNSWFWCLCHLFNVRSYCDVSEDSDNRVCLSFWLLALCISSTSHFMSPFFVSSIPQWHESKDLESEDGEEKVTILQLERFYQWSLFGLSANWTTALGVQNRPWRQVHGSAFSLQKASFMEMGQGWKQSRFWGIRSNHHMMDAILVMPKLYYLYREVSFCTSCPWGDFICSCWFYFWIFIMSRWNHFKVFFVIPREPYDFSFDVVSDTETLFLSIQKIGTFCVC